MQQRHFEVYVCKMAERKIISFILVLGIVLTSLPLKTHSAEKSAYEVLSEQTPVYVSSIAMDGFDAFYSEKSTDEILSNAENNYVCAPITVSGKSITSHVYMRCFSISDISKYTAEQASEQASKILSHVKSAVAKKYLKCIVRQYSISVSVKQDKKNGKYTSMTVRLFIAVGESNEQRKEVISSFVAPNADTWSELDIGEKLTSLNSFILNGQFAYDVSLHNRSSIYEFICDKKGVCEEYAGLTALFLDYMNIENYLITGKVGGVGHMWNMVKIYDRYYHLDILWDGAVNNEGVHTSISTKYLLVSTQSVSKTHSPDVSFENMTSLAVYDFVFGQTPKNIETRLYEIKDGKMVHIPILTTVEFFLSSLDEGEFVTVKCDENELQHDELVGSGCVIELNVNGEIRQSLTACVVGDCTGDGRTTRKDIEKLRDLILGRETQNTELLEFWCDINEDGNVTVTDIFVFDNLMKQTRTDTKPSVTEPQYPTDGGEDMPDDEKARKDDKKDDAEIRSDSGNGGDVA